MSRPLRIVAADDDLDLIRYYVRMIPRMKHRLVAQASNGSSLVKLCLQLRPDLVLSDIQMPRLDGISAMQQVQSVLNIPFIFVTADDQDSHSVELRESRVLDYLEKPVGREQLCRAINSAAEVVVG